MTSHVGRLYAIAGSLLVFFVLWAALAAHPWQSADPDPRLAALTARELRLQRETARVKRVLDRRFAAYRVALARRQRAIARAQQQAQTQSQAAEQLAAAPVAPRVVSLPPLTVTRSS